MSERRVSLGGIQSAELKPFTSAAMRVGSADASKRVMGATPLTPVEEVIPGLGDADPDGRDDAEPGDDDSALRLVRRALPGYCLTCALT